VSEDRCPCGSGDVYRECCEPLHSGAGEAPTARALMASRYSAFAVGDAAYLSRTWHPSTRPASLDLDPDLRWLRLEILEVVGGGPFDDSGVVSFRAHHRSPRGRGVLAERSRFVREAGRWLYLDGTVS